MSAFPRYVAAMIALKARRLDRLRRKLRADMPAPPDADRSAEERWEAEGGKSRSARAMISRESPP